MKPSQAQNDNLINHTCQVWQPRFGRNLSPEDARQIIKDVTGLFNVLTEWAETSTPANDHSVRDEVHYDRLQTRHSKTALCALPSIRKGGAV